MRGRPKLEDSRNNQYRVRLNDKENRKLNYVSNVTGKPKSEIFRLALIDYYNTVLLNEANQSDPEDEYWGLNGISLKRIVKCPYCGFSVRVDLEDECPPPTHENRPMGPDNLYEFNYEETCRHCNRKFKLEGYICEYPAGALDSEEIRTLPIPQEEE